MVGIFFFLVLFVIFLEEKNDIFDVMFLKGEGIYYFVFKIRYQVKKKKYVKSKFGSLFENIKIIEMCLVKIFYNILISIFCSAMLLVFILFYIPIIITNLIKINYK